MMMFLVQNFVLPSPDFRSSLLLSGLYHDPHEDFIFYFPCFVSSPPPHLPSATHLVTLYLMLSVGIEEQLLQTHMHFSFSHSSCNTSLLCNLFCVEELVPQSHMHLTLSQMLDSASLLCTPCVLRNSSISPLLWLWSSAVLLVFTRLLVLVSVWTYQKVFIFASI